MAQLEPEQEALLITMVEIHRQVPREARGPFFLLQTMAGSRIIHSGLRNGWEAEASKSDLDMLARYGLLAYERGKTPKYSVTPEGIGYYEALKAERAGRFEQVESEVTRYLDSEGFHRRHPRALALWSQADTSLWGSDSQKQLTTIGHVIREAMQAFATELVAQLGVEAGADPAHDVARIRAVLADRKAQLGDTHAAMLDALLAYWGTVSDLAQRQEHGAQREGEALSWEDARRLVFQSAVVMYEVDRSV